MEYTKEQAQFLFEHGYVVISGLNTDGRIQGVLNEFPEYKVQGTDKGIPQRVLGGFGAYGNPSSFHHPYIRTLRAEIKNNIVAPVLKMYVGILAESYETSDLPSNLESLFDRVCVRKREFGAVSAESWHRDVYSPEKYTSPGEDVCKALSDDILFGGWANLNCTKEGVEPQVFSCVPGTHMEVLNSKFKGRIEGGDLKRMKQDGGFEILPDQDQYKDVSIKVKIHPGEVLIFHQGLIHEVAPVKYGSSPSVRLFIGHRLTRETKIPLFGERATTKWIQTQAVPRIPSGQYPPMFSQNHYAGIFKGGKLTQWGEAVFVPSVLRPTHSVKPDGTKVYYSIPTTVTQPGQRKMGSLLDLGIELYPEYTEEDIKVLTPTPLF